MQAPPEILGPARARAQGLRLPYAGALLPVAAYALAHGLPDAKLVDVRSRAEPQ